MNEETDHGLPVTAEDLAFAVLDRIAEDEEKIQPGDVTVYDYITWHIRERGRAVQRSTAKNRLNALMAAGHFERSLFAVRDDGREVQVWRPRKDTAALSGVS